MSYAREHHESGHVVVDRATGRKVKEGLDKGRAERVAEAMNHKDVPGAGAKERREHLQGAKDYMQADMAEFKRGTLRSGSGEVVTNRKQALAISLSEARKHGRL